MFCVLYVCVVCDNIFVCVSVSCEISSVSFVLCLSKSVATLLFKNGSFIYLVLEMFYSLRFTLFFFFCIFLNCVVIFCMLDILFWMLLRDVFMWREFV